MSMKSARVGKVVALAAAGLVASTGATTAVAKDRFEAVVQISEVLTLGGDNGACAPDVSFPSVALGDINGSGLGPVIGTFTLKSVDCVRSTTSFFTPPYTFSSTNIRLTASNGDQIFASYGGTGDMQPTGLLVLKGTFTFTGGTGRYSRVKGSGTLTGVQDVSTVPATGYVTLSGTLVR
jgi:type 1 fimbria pilin